MCVCVCVFVCLCLSGLQNISILSTDDGVPALNIEESFAIDVVDVNEVISSINITGNTVRA